MTIWSELQALPEEAQQQVHQIYGEQFPIEVRCALAQWIEDQPWKDLDADNPQHEQYAANLVASLIAEIETKANSEEHYLMKFKLIQSAQTFRVNYAHNPFVLVCIVKHCLSKEAWLIQQSRNYLNISNSETKPVIRNPRQEISQQMENLRKQTIETEEEIRRMQQDQEQLIIQHQELQRRVQQLDGQQNQSIEYVTKCQKENQLLDSAIKTKAKQLFQRRVALINKHTGAITALQALQHRVLDEELLQWKRGQQLSGNGVPFDNNLDEIQEWCEVLAEAIWAHRQQINRLAEIFRQLPLTANQPNGHLDQLQSMNAKITTLLSNLVESTFIIEKQPPQVMKTNTRFTSTVRLLVGGKLNVQMTPPQVKVTIISETQANSMSKFNRAPAGEASGEILNHFGTMEYQTGTRQLTVHFRNMQLKKIKRAEKKGTESVMDEKFALLFQSEFKVGGELVFTVRTLSLPVVVIVHGNQEPNAWATVTWDNAFGAVGRTPFTVPDKVQFSQVGEVLSQKFKHAMDRGLNEDNLRFLAGKAFRNPHLQDWNNQLLSWSLFSKEPLPGHNFSFWEWLYAILKVTREHMRGLWSDGSVMGFVSRRQAEEMLCQKTSGTFLLRYSDSELGGVTVAWVAEGQEGVVETYMLQPFTSRDFQIRGLADRINDLKHLTFLYPDIPKDQALSQYYTPFQSQPSSSNGYVRPVLVTFIPNWPTNSPFDSFPNTPQSVNHNPQSPSDSSLLYDNSSVQSVSNDCTMNPVGTGSVDDNTQVMHMDFVSEEMNVPIDFSSINVSELMSYSKSA